MINPTVFKTYTDCVLREVKAMFLCLIYMTASVQRVHELCS